MFVVFFIQKWLFFVVVFFKISIETGVCFLSRVGGTSVFSNQILEQKLFVIISMLLQIEQTGILDDFVLGF